MDVELKELNLLQIDTRVRRTPRGGSRSVPASPPSGLASAPEARNPSILHTGDLSLLRQPPTHNSIAPRASFVQSGRMTKVPHYGRLRSVTARVLRMMDPRTLSQQQNQQPEAEVDDGTAAGVLGRSVVDTMRGAAGRHRQRVQRRYSLGSVPVGVLSRLASRESHGRLRLSIDSHAPRRSMERVQSRLSESRAPSMQSTPAAVESVIAIPMPGFFLSAASDDWTGGHSFRQRLRYPDEAITVPASLTKRVHYEVSYDYPKNAISTARYNVVTFLPAQLAAQFSKVANIYFLFVAALQQVPGWSTTGRWTTILPLSIFVCLSIAHEAFDDIRRHRMDHAENAQRTRVLKVKVHDRERVSFSFRDLRHRGSHSIHSIRMRGSQSIHDIGRSAVDRVGRWAVAAASIGTTVREHVGARMAEKRRKKRELEDSDDEDEQVAAPDGDESLLRRQITRGVMSLRSWRGPPAMDSTRQSAMDSVRRSVINEAVESENVTPLHESANDVSYPASYRPRAPMVAFNDDVEEMTYDDDAAQANPLPENMSCRWKKKRWENVQVGDLLMICKDDWIPADCVVVASTGFDGTCFVETAALDGETTLKQKQALEATNSAVQTAEQLAAFDAFTYVEQASPELYSFEGFMEIDGTRHPLTPNQLLLRGSVLRNTAYVFAQVVYSGEHTRLRLNATRNVRTKAPQIQRITNRIVLLVFALLLVLCVIFAALGIHWNDHGRRGHWYLESVHMPATALLFGYIVMMNALIPISLYVTLEAVKIFQCWFIQQDIEMYHAPSDTRAEARTTAINEDLGMVRYVFSDKTGTLTENIMKLRALMIAGFSYLHIDLDRLTPDPVQSKPTSSSPSAQGGLAKQMMFAKNNQHRRQHSMPMSMPNAPRSPRTLQHLAAANRASPFSSLGPSSPWSARHSRGMSASVLRSPLQNEVPLLKPLDTAASSSPNPELSDLELDSPEPTARDDAPVSDLQALPSSRRIMGAPSPTQVFRARAEWFLRCLALCHTVQPDRDPLTGRITGYQATSPDEKALVAAAAELGYVMNNRAGPLVQLRVVASERMRDFNAAVVNTPEPSDHETSEQTTPDHQSENSASDHESDKNSSDHQSEQSFDRGVPAPHPTDRLGSYEVLDVLEFSSARKRMSVILRCADGRIVMMSKGADSAIWPRLRKPAQLRSDAGDMSFMPRPTPPTDKFATPAPLMLRRKLSQPSAAYLHSRSAASMSSSPMSSTPIGSMPMSSTPIGSMPLSLTPDADEGGTSAPAVARLADGSMYFGQLGSTTPPSDIAPMSAPANASTFMTSTFAPQHRRLMSDSQFSAFSDVSSFADTQGQVEIPPSFDEPTAEEEEWARARALEALHQFSTEGLRTLAYAHKEISEAAYEAWHVRYMAASTALSNRQQQVEAVCEEIEKDLLLSGVSAIEDRLQEGVPETIYMLRRAGIRVWMLTGDKVETAINIAKSCRLIDTDVVETTELDTATIEKNKDKMLLLLMQSLTDVDDLERVVSQALDVARAMGASVDQRFERRSRLDKLRRGMKKFGNMLNPRRAKKTAQLTEAEPATSKNTEYLNQPLDQAKQESVERQPMEIEWAADVNTATPEAQKQRLLLSAASSATSRPSDVTRGVSKPGSSETARATSLAVVVDGETLSALEAHEGLLQRFLSLGTLCDAVICSRVSPSQKALIVHNMRVRCEGGNDGSSKSKDKKLAGWWLGAAWRGIVSFFRHDSDRYMVTLAIGDGGNDIAMIQEAHAGIGIAGQEGLQASRAADFSIGQFRFLQRLLLVHGRWSYVRVSMFIMGTFYKCMAFYLTQLIYQFYTGFSGTSLFESWTLSMYNTLFSILPVLVVGIFEQDLKPSTLLAFPELYRDMGPRNHLFTVPEFLRRVIVLGLLHAIVAAYFPFAGGLLMGYNGTTNDQFINSLMVYSIMMLTVTLKIAYIDVRRWIVFSHISVILSLTLWFGWNGVLNHIYPKSPGDGYFVLGVFDMLMSKAPFWFQWIIFTAVALCINVLLVLVYSVRDPVEHKITSWVAFERRQEHTANKERRKQWMADHKLGRFS
ncbi:hypothetical protein IW142_000421 [Coemansia sp. RSA 564]|nr:hypothetical protein IW142_000421 [Coemansia sp. RSA 564]